MVGYRRVRPAGDHGTTVLAAILTACRSAFRTRGPGRLSAATRPGWLLPGFTATGHLNAATMSKHMKAYGIPTRSARNAALIRWPGNYPSHW